MSSNIPKEPGLYPFIYYRREANEEQKGVAQVNPIGQETRELVLLWERGGTPKIWPYATAEVLGVEFGPCINFPCGGWPTKKEKK